MMLPVRRGVEVTLLRVRSIAPSPRINSDPAGSREHTRTDSLITRTIGQLQSTLCYPGGRAYSESASTPTLTESLS